MYQALYRKWRPKTFDDVVGQSHITDTLKQQVAGNRLSHAYLFTGTRGTGKTSCAKIMARAVNCLNPLNGNPCNCCSACEGIENGSVLDVLELDAASNNGVDQVRALRDEAVYTPASVRKRVYIVDEVHMLSTPAFNALLKILEEPPEHLMFILATTELHKVPATIKSRCQQFSFKRILPMEIAQRLGYVAQEENIELTDSGAQLLARLADGGLRDGLSLLDQCAGAGQRVDEREILDTLGLAGNLETANLMRTVAAHNTAQALDTLGRLYSAGKDVSSVLDELACLSRDLLLRKTAPQGGAALLTGGYDEGTMRELGEQFTAGRLLQMLTQLQNTLADLGRGGNRRTDAELCLIRLCDEGLDQSLAGLAVRVARLEEMLVNAAPMASAQPAGSPPKQRGKPAYKPERPTLPEDPVYEPERPPLPEEQVYEPERPPLPEEPPLMPGEPELCAPVQQASVSKSQQVETEENTAFWPSFVQSLRGKVTPTVMPHLTNPEKVTGVWKNGHLTLWVDSEFTHRMLNKPMILNGIAQAAQVAFGCPAQVSVVTGKPPATKQMGAAPAQERDALDDLIAFGSQFDNIIIQ